MAKKVILDTDIGSDIDDAVCLAYLLSQPECELLGITTVSGEPEKRAMIASAICKAAKKDIPIYPGIEAPLLTEQRQPKASQAEALIRWDHDRDFPRGMAIDFLRKTIRDNPGEVTLLTIGPLTNIALLFSIDPEIPYLLKELVLMCGVFATRPAGWWLAEWNALCDPYATAMVYNAPVKVHRSVGLDVTTRVVMKRDEVQKRFKADVLQPVMDFAGVWFRHADEITFHDPLAATIIFDEGICRFAKGNIDIELQSDKLRGLTHWKQDDGNGVRLAALDVDAGRFFEHYFSVVNGGYHDRI